MNDESTTSGLKNNSTIFKEQLKNISTVLNNSGNTTKLLTSFNSLDIAQQKVLLSSKLLTEEQKAQCLTMTTLSSANAKYTAEQLVKATGISTETLAAWGLTEATDTLTISQLAEMASSDAQAKTVLDKIIAQNAQAVANGKVTTSNITLTTSETGVTLATGAFTTAIEANIAAIKTWLLTTPTGWLTMLVGGIFLAVKAYDALTVSVEEQKEKMEDSLSAYKDAESELSNITAELKSQEKAMDDLLKKDKLTYAEKGQLEELQAITQELRIQKDLAEEEEGRTKKEVATDASDLFNKQFGKYNISESAINEYQNNADITGNNAILISDDNDISAMIAGYRQFNELLDEAYGSGSQEDIYHFKTLTSDLYDSILAKASDLQEQQSNISKYYEDIKNIPYEDLTPDQQEIVDSYNAISNAIALIYKQLKPDTWNSMQIDNLFATDGIEKTKEELIAMAKEGTLDENVIKSYSKLNATLEDSNMVLFDGQSAASALCDEIYALADAEKNVQGLASHKSGIVSDIFSLKNAKDELTNLGKISESIDTIQNAYKTLNDAIEEYNENGEFSVDTLQSVIALGDDWLDYLVDEEGKLKLDKESLEALTKSRLEDMRVQAINNVIDNVSNINNDISAKEYLESTNYAVAKSYEELTEKTLAFKRADLIDSGVSESMADAVISKAQADIEKINKLFDNVDMSVESLAGGKGKSSSKSSSETIDWIETLLSRIQRTITNLGKTVSATYKNWSKRNNALAQEMKEINKEIDAQSTAYNTYMAKANSISLPDEYKSLVRNGGFSFSEIKDEALKKNIDLYRQWYEKALNCSDAIEDLRSNLADLAKTKFDNVSKQYDNQMLMIDHNIQMLQGFVEQSESAGYMASEVYYQAMAEKQQESIAQLQDKYGSLLSAFDEAVKNGSIEKYSEEWYNMLGDINDVEKALQSANTQLIKFNQTLQQLGWSVFDRIRDSVDGISTEANFLIDLISRSDLFTEAGQMTNEGLAVQGLHAVNYNTYMEQSLAYAKEIEKINDEIAKDPYDLELINRKNELIKAQQEAIQNANAEKESIHDLVSQGYDKMLESLQNVINKRKELLNSQKD